MIKFMILIFEVCLPLDHTKNLFRGAHDDDISISNIWNEIGDTFNSSEKMMLLILLGTCQMIFFAKLIEHQCILP